MGEIGLAVQALRSVLIQSFCAAQAPSQDLAELLRFPFFRKYSRGRLRGLVPQAPVRVLGLNSSFRTLTVVPDLDGLTANCHFWQLLELLLR